MTYGTIAFGFFQGSTKFRQNVMYWHFIPSCTELGFQCPGKSVPESMQSFADGIEVQKQIVFASGAAQLAKNKKSLKPL